MSVVMIGKFGKSEEGIFTYRISATAKDDLYTIIEEAKELGFRFWEKPVIEKAHRTWSVLLKLYIPKEMGYLEESL